MTGKDQHVYQQKNSENALKKYDKMAKSKNPACQNGARRSSAVQIGIHQFHDLLLIVLD
jgi:hypothetical protein